METAAVTSKFHVPIPQAARKMLRLRARQNFHVSVYEGRIELIPFKPIKKTPWLCKRN